MSLPDTPTDGDEYIHTETDDLVEYLTRDDEAYRFSINNGERTLVLPTEDWPTYREFLDEL